MLSDPEKRKVYDNFGKAGLEGGASADAAHGPGPEEIFRSFFGARHRRSDCMLVAGINIRLYHPVSTPIMSHASVGPY